MSSLKNEKNEERTPENRGHYVRPYVSSVKSSLFAEIDKSEKNKRPRIEEDQDLIFPLDLTGNEEIATSPLNFERNPATQKTDAQSITSYASSHASSYASTINIILHKEKDTNNKENRAPFNEDISEEKSIFNTPIKRSEAINIKRSSSGKSEPFCHSIFQTPSPTKSASPEKLKTQRQSDPDMLPFTAPQGEKWDFLEYLRKEEEKQQRFINLLSIGS